MHFRVTYRAAYFNRTAFCNIPAHYIAQSDCGMRYDGHSLEDVKATCIRFHGEAVTFDNVSR